MLETTAPFFTLFRQGMLDAAEEQNIKLIWHSVKEPPPGWWQRQWYRVHGWPPSITPLNREKAFVIRTLRDRVSALVVQPVSVDKFDDVIRRAQLARVPLITMETLPYNRRVAGHTQLNAIGQGAMAAQFAVDEIGGRGNIILVAGPTGNTELHRTVLGMYQVLDQYADSIRVFERAAAKLEADEAFVIVSDLLTRYAGNVQAVIACEPRLSEGSIRGVRAHGLEDRIVTVGVGAGREACAALLSTASQAGAVHDMEVDPMPYEWGKQLMESVSELIYGGTTQVLPHNEMRSNGDVDVPVFYAPARTITPRNVGLMESMWPDIFADQ